MNKSIIAAVLLTIMTASGCVFDSDDKDAVKRGSVSGTVKMMVTGEAVPGVTVYLLDRDAAIDTSGSNNTRALVDSASTDSSGKYSIGNIAPGNYAVAPVKGDTTTVYQFRYAAGSDSSGFAVNGDTHTVGFIAEKMNYPGAENGVAEMITFYIYGPLHPINSIEVYRKHWILFVPFFWFENRLAYHESLGCYADSYAPGFSWGMHTEENVFKFVVNYWKDGILTSNEVYVGFSLDVFPQVSSWNYDVGTNTLSSRTGRPVVK